MSRKPHSKQFLEFRIREKFKKKRKILDWTGLVLV